jgi:Secretion system C-terminal sorting domain
MKKKVLFLVLPFVLPILLRGQSVAFTKVYGIFQTKCAPTCHSNAIKSGGLDLEGSGTDKPSVVYNALVNVTPSNATASAKGHKRIYPGRVDRSFLFHKINGDFDTYYPTLTETEGSSMPKEGTTLTKVEKEIIRQWILYGANKTAIIPDDRIRAYYDTVGKALAAFNVPPAAPSATEGFQIKMGPFFLAPNGRVGKELEYYQKWELNMASDLEVNRIDHIISSSSHHFLIYNFNKPSDATNIPAGLRTNANHNNINLVSAVQERLDLKLPAKTAFIWEKNRVLDLNSHYINYSSTHVYKAEAFLNIYTQPLGTARQEMKTILIPNTFIFIPNNNQTVSFRQPVTNSGMGKIFVWAIVGHTHKYGTGYKVYRRNNDGSDGELIYDGSCPGGIPGCPAPNFDYQHIPMRYFQPLNPLAMATGFTHEATWKNNGPVGVTFGPTSDDEMQVLIAMYTSDTTGLARSKDIIEIEDVSVYPNPVTDKVTFKMPPSVYRARFTLFDVLGRIVQHEPMIVGQIFDFERNSLQSGVYLYRIEDQDGRVKMGKILFR